MSGEKKKLLPKLRFPEFRNAEEWEEKSLEEVADVVASGDLNSELFSPTRTDTHSYPVYSNSVTEEGLYGFYSSSKYKKNSVTVTARGTLGVAFSRSKDFMAIGRLLVFGELKNTDSYFLKELWNYSANVPHENGGIPQLTAVKAKAVKLTIPRQKEQQKITDCLSSLDEFIAAQARKVDALKTHKKGLMQQLFPREGETQPGLRFSEFRNAGDWVVLPIGDKVDLLSGYPFDGPDISQDSTGVPLLRGINVTEGRVRHNPEIDRYFTGPIEALEKYKLQLNDLVIGMDGSKVGKNSALITTADVGALLIQRVARLRAKNVDLIQFIFQQIHSSIFHRYVDKINTSSGIPHISAKQIKEFCIAFPSNQEQKRIADFLSNFDTLITTATQELHTLKTHKKALMQQLFPSAEAVEA